MVAFARFPLPIPAFGRYDRHDLPADVMAAFAMLFLAVPQGLAYATIAGLPPAMGLYAAALPTVIGSVFRSSRHVVAGPTNALSLLVGASLGPAVGVSPAEAAVTLALMVGVFQVLAGTLRLGALVDYISSAVVLGYITGAGVLIAIGQLHNVTATAGPRGGPWVVIGGWLADLGHTSPLAVTVAVATIAGVFAIRWLNRRTQRRLPSAIVVIIASITVDLALGLEDRGLRVISDLAPIPAGSRPPRCPTSASPCPCCRRPWPARCSPSSSRAPWPVRSPPAPGIGSSPRPSSSARAWRTSRPRSSAATRSAAASPGRCSTRGSEAGPGSRGSPPGS